VKRICGNCKYFERRFSKHKLGEKYNICKHENGLYSQGYPVEQTTAADFGSRRRKNENRQTA